MNEFILFNYYRSSASFRVRIALNIKNIKYDYRAIHLLKNDQYSSDYLQLNPSQQVPTLIHNGQPIGQSMAIIDYLDQIQPSPALFPKGALQRAQVLQACEIVNSGAQPLHNLRVLSELEKRFGAVQKEKDAWTVFWIQTSLDALENLLAKTAGDYCFGNSVSAADCFLIPHMANANRFKVDVASYKSLVRIQENCMKLEAFLKSAPNVQPDTPPE